MGTIRMTVVPIDWTMGDVGHVFIKLRKGSCRIDWGDGKSTPLFTYKEDWLSANHTYPSGCKISKEPFEITITSMTTLLLWQTYLVLSRAHMRVAVLELVSYAISSVTPYFSL